MSNEAIELGTITCNDVVVDANVPKQTLHDHINNKESDGTYTVVNVSVSAISYGYDVHDKPQNKATVYNWKEND